MAVPRTEVSPNTPYLEIVDRIISGNELGYIYNYPDKRLYGEIADPSRFIEEAWQGYEGDIGLYVHVPWCTPKPPTDDYHEKMKTAGLTKDGKDSLCAYCNLYTAVRGGGIPDWYTDAIVTEIHKYKKVLGGTGSLRARSMYFGGGSPSLLNAQDMGKIIKALEEVVGPVDDEFERAIEVIPDSVDFNKLQEMRGFFNRISVGVQSFDPVVLRATGRDYEPNLAKQVIADAKALGFKDINGDLIAGLPGSNQDSFLAGVDEMIGTGVTTVTIYQNMIRPGTRAGKMAAAGLISYEDSPTILNQIGLANEKLQEAGFKRLSLTCWSKTTGYQQGEDIYNGVPILGVGAGARSHAPHGHYALPYTEDTRLINNAINRYKESLSQEEWPEYHGVAITEDIAARSKVILGMMSEKGIDLTIMLEKFSHQLAALRERNLVLEEGGMVRYTEVGKAHSGALATLFFSKEDLAILNMKNSVRTH